MEQNKLSPAELLDCFRLQHFPRTFILGCFARHVTIYSQQVRAINLVDSLFHQQGENLNPSKTKLLVIGAGVAGLTAAAAAAQLGVHIVILEQEADSLTLQRHNQQRYLHPHISKWPDSAWEETYSNLPVLTWEAGITNEVFAKILDQWINTFAKYPNIITRFGATLTELTLAKDNESENLISWEDRDSGGCALFDSVIIAVGFGDERRTSDDFKRYWDNDDLDKIYERNGEKWLVSGVGDGGLTDIMRLCIKDFNHEKVLRIFAQHTEFTSQIMEIDQEIQRNPKFDISKAYTEIFKDRKEDILEWFEDAGIEARNELQKVVLGGKKISMFQANSSRINRFIVAALYELELFDYRQFSPESERNNNPKRDDDDGMFYIDFLGGEETFHHIVQRHGVNSPLYKENPMFEEIKEDCNLMKEKWQKFGEYGDLTPIPIFNRDKYSVSRYPSAAKKRENPAFYNRSTISSIIIQTVDIENPRDSLLARIVDSMLGREDEVLMQGDELELQFSCQPFIVDAMSLSTTYKSGNLSSIYRIIRFICGVEIAIFDITEDDKPIIFFLLGVRAVTRRGVTIIASQEEQIEKIWRSLPFNIREMAFVSLHDESEAPQELWKLVIRGMQGLKNLSDYSDVPAYWHIRHVEPDTNQDSLTIDFREYSLLMCPYLLEESERELTSDPSKWLIQQINLSLENGRGGPVKRIIDIPSPELTSRLLYKGLRRNKLCIFDLSEWRANVLYELGVRCAATEQPIICLIHQNSDHSSVDKKWIFENFKPLRYRPFSGQPAFRNALKQQIRELIHNGNKDRFNVDIFKEVCRSMHIDHENQNIRPDQKLFNSFQCVMGSGGTSDMNPRALYAQNDMIRIAKEEEALHDLIAAWLYIEEQLSIEEERLDPDGKIENSIRRNHMRIESALLESLQNRTRKDELMNRILKRIQDKKDRHEKLPENRE